MAKEQQERLTAFCLEEKYCKLNNFDEVSKDKKMESIGFVVMFYLIALLGLPISIGISIFFINKRSFKKSRSDFFKGISRIGLFIFYAVGLDFLFVFLFCLFYFSATYPS